MFGIRARTVNVNNLRTWRVVAPERCHVTPAPLVQMSTRRNRNKLRMKSRNFDKPDRILPAGFFRPKLEFITQPERTLRAVAGDCCVASLLAVVLLKLNISNFQFKVTFYTVGIWIATIWIPETFEYRPFWSLDFKWFSIQMVSLWTMS